MPTIIPFRSEPAPAPESSSSSIKTAALATPAAAALPEDRLTPKESIRLSRVPVTPVDKDAVILTQLRSSPSPPAGDKKKSRKRTAAAASSSQTAAEPKSKAQKPKPKEQVPSSSSRGSKVRSVFPASYGPVDDFQRISLYARKGPQGIKGIVLEAIGGRAVIKELEDGYRNPSGLQAGDALLSVNHLDARYARLNDVLAALVGPEEKVERALGESVSSTMLRNQTSEGLVCVCFARPR